MKPRGDDSDDGCRCGSRNRALRCDRVHGEYYHTTFRRAAWAADYCPNLLETNEVRVPNGRHILDLFKDAVGEGGVCAVCLDRDHANRSR